MKREFLDRTKSRKDTLPSCACLGEGSGGEEEEEEDDDEAADPRFGPPGRLASHCYPSEARR